MAHLGFPYADVVADGAAAIGKVEGTGGRITLATVKEQLLYEVTNPFGYVTPDMIADFSAVELNRPRPIGSPSAVRAASRDRPSSR